MLRNYLISAIRNMTRNKAQTIIQLVSLTIGITAAILFGLHALYELTYDRFHENRDRIYRLQYGNRVGMPSAVGHMIKQNIPEVENVVRIVSWRGKDDQIPISYYPDNDTTAVKMNIMVEDRIECDSTIFDIFSFRFIQGDPETALRDPYSVVLTPSYAKMIFGDRDPVGEFLGKTNIKVTGVIEDVSHSHIEIKSMVSLTSFAENVKEERSFDPLNTFSRGNYSGFMTYLLLPENSDPERVAQRLNEFFFDRFGDEEFFKDQSEFSLLPIEDIYFSTGWEAEFNYCRHGSLSLLKVLGAAAFLILLLGIINYINLTTARASLRSREVSIRSVVGASKRMLIFQFLSEAILVTIISFLIALTLVQLLLPAFNQIGGTELDMQFLNHPPAWVVILLFILVIGFFSGIYPAFYLSGYSARKSLSGKRYSNAQTVFRRVMLTFQFTISAILIISITVIYKQLNYMKEADPGFNKELVLFAQVPLWQHDQDKRIEFKNILINHPGVTGVTFSSNIMGSEQAFYPINYKGEQYSISDMGISPDFFNVMDIEVLKGTEFSWDRPSGEYDTTDSDIWEIVVNEAFVRELEVDSPVGHFLDLDGQYRIKIIGVVQDFNFNSQHEKIMPMSFSWWGFQPYIIIRITPLNIGSTISYINDAYNDYIDPEGILNYYFLDEYYARQYLQDEKTSNMIVIFALVALIIACLGLFGLSNFMAARRIKEIGVRKTFGASEGSVFMLLAREFLKWVGLALLIACPAGWIIMHQWLQSYAYQTNISWWIFALTILIALLITFATVTWQSLRTARTNPVDALKYE